MPRPPDSLPPACTAAQAQAVGPPGAPSWTRALNFSQKSPDILSHRCPQTPRVSPGAGRLPGRHPARDEGNRLRGHSAWDTQGDPKAVGVQSRALGAPSLSSFASSARPPTGTPSSSPRPTFPEAPPHGHDADHRAWVVISDENVTDGVGVSERQVAETFVSIESENKK